MTLEEEEILAAATIEYLIKRGFKGTVEILKSSHITVYNQPTLSLSHASLLVTFANSYDNGSNFVNKCTTTIHFGSISRGERIFCGSCPGCIGLQPADPLCFEKIFRALTMCKQPSLAIGCKYCEFMGNKGAVSVIG